MNDQTDTQMLRAYAEHRSEPAFAELVRRHVDFVYSAARRMVCDSHLAQDVTQAVFVALARNAAQLTDRQVLSGWLHRTAQNIAAQTVRSEVRRRAREQEAAAMNELLSAEPDIVWEHIAPHLDAALGELNEGDRDALLLRYFECKSAREMAQILGLTDEAAQKRVSRAVDRLREFFSKRGVTVGASGLAVVISANAVQAAPASLMLTISTAAVLTGTTLTTTATVTATKAIAMTALQKTIVTATIAVLAGAGIYEARQASQLRDEVQSLQQQKAPLTEQIRKFEQEQEEAARQLAALRDDNERLNRNTAELLRLRGEVARLRNEIRELAETAGKKTDPAESLMLEGIRWLPEWKDAGLASPEATLETYFWAQANGNVDRLKELMVFDRGTNIVPVSDLYAKREARQDGDTWRAATIGGVRIHRKFVTSVLDADRASFEVEYMGPGFEGGRKVSPNVIVDAKVIPVDPANPPTWSPTGSPIFDLVRVDGQWKIDRRESLVRMTIDDEDSEAMAKMMMQMDPETLEKLKANPQLPAKTLRAYEELKAKSAQ
ncbi:MAG: sigma-70 family RNA polymerase sigma factor [Verrucomicrobia bacterium]|nr:sigma-70 family RNA polymerase sigma factor [Verrucomicrobiota bacterium]